ncbi:MAG: flagellar biosynthesis protein FlhA [Paracoccaceae bacterium]
MKNLNLSLFNPTVALAFALMAIIVMMILPVPSIFLDIGLAVSFSLAVLIFTVTLFISRPLDFSAFPTILLASLMLRLSLNVSSTKLIIGEGHTGTGAAGGVIEGFANFVMGGSIFLGLVVFLVLLIVNFMVITKGAARMAEVGARFALDGMPGKQMAIDSDVAAGALTHEQAKARRELEQQETTFFGSLDGASKFVKGDAVAGLLIIILNLVAGLIMGVVVHGMAFPQAFQTYAILTVGDGLVSQIPAVIISIASALLLARGGNKGATDLAVFDQLGRFPAALFSVAGLMFVFALFPGLPFIPFVAGSIAIAAAGYWRVVQNKNPVEVEAEAPKDAAPVEKPIGDLLELDDIHVEFAPNLVNMVLDPGTGLDIRIVNMRRHVVSQFGVILPEIRLSDNGMIADGSYVVKIQGVEQARGHLETDKVMMLLPDGSGADLPGTPAIEPVYGAPAKWVGFDQKDAMAMEGLTLVTSSEILATHLLEVIKKNLSRLLTYKSLRRMLSELTSISDPVRADANKRLLDELVPEKIPMELLLSVLKLLLEEQVSIRNLPLILEAILEGKTTHGSQEAICEHVRHRLGFQLTASLRRDDGTIPLLQLSPEWEEVFATYQVGDARSGVEIALPPNLFNSLADNIATKIRQANDTGVFPAIVTSTQRRRFLRTLFKAKGITASVLSFEEIGTDAKPSLVGVVDM